MLNWPKLGWWAAIVLVAAFALAANAAPPAQTASPAMIVVSEALMRNGFSIRHDHSEARQNITRLYFSPAANSGYVDVPSSEIVSIQRMEVPAPPPPTGADVKQIVSEAGGRHQIDPDLINSVIRAESGFNPQAVSPKGARGLMQLMPQTAAQLGVKDAFQPAENVDGGTRYLRQLLELYHGDMARALAAYNAGPQRVEQFGGVPPYRETHAYVARVIRDFNRTKLAEDPTLAKPRRKKPAHRSSGTRDPANAKISSLQRSQPSLP